MNDDKASTTTSTALGTFMDVPMSSEERRTLSFLHAKVVEVGLLAARNGIPYHEDPSAAKRFVKKWQSRAIRIPQQAEETEPRRIPVHIRSEDSRVRRGTQAQGNAECYAEEHQDLAHSCVVGESEGAPGSPANHNPRIYAVQRLPLTVGGTDDALQPPRQADPRGILADGHGTQNVQRNTRVLEPSEATDGFCVPAVYISDQRRLRRSRN